MFHNYDAWSDCQSIYVKKVPQELHNSTAIHMASTILDIMLAFQL